MKLLIYSFFVALAIPFFTFSIGPKDPKDSCDRFINEADKKQCLQKATSTNMDWYASSLCEKIDDDKIFLSCFDAIEKAQFDPRGVEACESYAAQDDSLKLRCLNLVKNKPVGDCRHQHDIESFEKCLSSTSGRLPAAQKSFFQK
jgi:hypothetical protein